MSLALALRHLYPAAEWFVVGDDYGTLEWVGPGTKPSEAELRAAEEDAAKAHRNRRQKDLRAEAYRAEADPLFFAWQRGEDDASEADWLAKVAEIRARFPYEV